MQQKNILLVDDEPANIQVLFAALQNMGKVQFATNGEKALQIAEETPPDIVFLDYFMPEMDGIAVCLALKQHPALAHIPVVFISGSSEAAEVEKALAAGAFDFMTKPIIPALVQRKAQIAFDLSAGAAPAAAPAIERSGPQSILLVEDGAINRAIIAEILESRGHKVSMAETGTEAITLAESTQFDSVLLDIHLPDMTGLKVIRHIRAMENETSQANIIAVTGDVTAESVKDYEEAGFNGVAPKPVNPDILLSQIDGASIDIQDDILSAPDLGGPDLLISQERVNVLKQTYSDIRLQGLFALFEKEVTSYLKALKQAQANDNAVEISRTAHRLKSALGHFACDRMQRVATILNKEKDLPPKEKARLVQMLEDQLPATLQALTGALDFQD